MSDKTDLSEEYYATLVQTFLSEPNVIQEGKGFGSSALKVKGKIFAMLVRGKLVVKLPHSRVNTLVTAGQGERFEPRRDGRLMKEWLTLSTVSQEEWLSYAKEAMDFVASS